MEYIIVGVIVIAAGYILYSTIKKQSHGDCGCENGCEGCTHSCEVKQPDKNNNKTE